MIGSPGDPRGRHRSLRVESALDGTNSIADSSAARKSRRSGTDAGSCGPCAILGLNLRFPLAGFCCVVELLPPMCGIMDENLLRDGWRTINDRRPGENCQRSINGREGANELHDGPTVNCQRDGFWRLSRVTGLHEVYASD